MKLKLFFMIKSLEHNSIWNNNCIGLWWQNQEWQWNNYSKF